MGHAPNDTFRFQGQCPCDLQIRNRPVALGNGHDQTLQLLALKVCEIASQYLKKGRQVYIEGRLQTRKWQDQSGQDKYSTEVVLRPYTSTLTMLDGRGDNQGGGGGGSQGGGGGAPSRDLDDEIPF